MTPEADAPSSPQSFDYEKLNESKDGITIVPVVRALNFQRIRPHQVSVWIIPGTGQPELRMLLHTIEVTEVSQLVRVDPVTGGGLPVSKQTRLEIQELGEITMTADVARGMINDILKLLNNYDSHSQ